MQNQHPRPGHVHKNKHDNWAFQYVNYLGYRREYSLIGNTEEETDRVIHGPPESSRRILEGID